MRRVIGEGIQSLLGEIIAGKQQSQDHQSKVGKPKDQI